MKILLLFSTLKLDSKPTWLYFALNTVEIIYGSSQFILNLVAQLAGNSYSYEYFKRNMPVFWAF